VIWKGVGGFLCYGYRVTLITGTIQQKKKIWYCTETTSKFHKGKGRIAPSGNGVYNKPDKISSLEFCQGYVSMSFSRPPRGKYHFPIFGFMDSLCVAGCRKAINNNELGTVLKKLVTSWKPLNLPLQSPLQLTICMHFQGHSGTQHQDRCFQ
jgi:hypothetical protein